MPIKNKPLTVNFLAWNSTGNYAQTGDSTNITMQIVKDGAAIANVTNSVSEVSATGMPGVYELALTDTEMNSNFLTLGGISSTSNVAVYPQFFATDLGYMDVVSGEANLIELAIPVGFSERTGVESNIITRANYPTMGVMFTDSTSTSDTDFLTDILIGATIHTTENDKFIILGGYYFDDTGDTTTKVFGIASGNYFDIYEGGTNIVDTLWAGTDLAEAGNGSAWTFVVANSSGTYPISDTELKIYTEPSVLRDTNLYDICSGNFTTIFNNLSDATLANQSTIIDNLATTSGNVTSIKSTVDTNLDTTVSSRSSQTSVDVIDNTIDTVSGNINNLNDVSITDIVASGNAEGWNDTSSLTAATIASTVVTSGNVENWNQYSDATLANQTTIINTLTTVSGDINGLNDLSITDVVDSGNANNWDATSTLTASEIATAVVTSGNVESWNQYSDATLSNQNTIINNLATVSGNVDNINTELDQVTVSGISPAALSEIITSGNAANWDQYSDATLANQNTIINNLATTSGNINSLNDVSITDIVSSGNAEEWNQYSDATLANQNTVINNLATTSGNVTSIKSTVDTNLDTTVSSRATQTSVDIIDNTLDTVSGNIDNINTELDQVTVSGISPAALSTIVTSGNAADWNQYSDATLANQTTIINNLATVSGNIDTIDTELNLVTVSGITSSALSEMVASGDAANWNQYSDATLSNQTNIINYIDTISGNIDNINTELNEVTVSGISPEALSEIIISGNAEGWNLPGISAAGIAGIVTDSGNAANWSGVGNLDTMENTLNTVSGNITTIQQNTDLLPTGLIDGKTSTEVQEILLAMAQGKFTKSGDSYTYYKQDNTTPLFILTISSASRIRP